MKSILRLSLCLVAMLCIGGQAICLAETLKPIEITGDLHISKHMKWKNAHYQVHGNIIFDKGGCLEVKNCTVELMCEYARQFAYKWDGGKLISSKSTLGGTIKDGAIRQCEFDLIDGYWICKDTTIRYCYGITFDYKDRIGHLRADNLIAGPYPDTIIMTGQADVVIKNSTYGISLTAYATKPIQSIIDLPNDKPINQVFDSSNIPGAPYRLQLINTKVRSWFLFVQGISMDGPPVELSLRNCPWLIPSIMGNDLKGTVNLPCAWDGMRSGKDGELVVKENTVVKVGNVQFKFLNDKICIPCWGVYLWGDKTDVTLQGPTVICELMLWEGKVSLLGSPNGFNATATATTIDVGREGSSALALLKINNATIGRFGKDDPVIGQITSKGNGRVFIDNARCARLSLITREKGEIQIGKIQKDGEFQLMQNGGPIKIEGDSR